MIEIDFNKTSPDYYFDKAEELKEQYRIEYKITEAEATEFNNPAISPGDIGKRDPEWPTNKKEAFELFKNYHAKIELLNICAFYLLKYGNQWNTDIIKDELKEIDQFIESSNTIDSRDVFDKYFSGNDRRKQIYRRLSLRYYDSEQDIKLDNKKHIKYDATAAAPVYAKYFLFRDLLKSKLQSKEATEPPATIENNSEDIKPINPHPRIFPNDVRYWQLFNDWQQQFIREKNKLTDYSFIYRVMWDDGFIFKGIGLSEFQGWIEGTFLTGNLGKQLKLLDVAKTNQKFKIYASLIDKYKLISITLQKRSKNTTKT